MMNDRERVMQHTKFGEVHFRKVPRSRSLRISIRMEKGVLVTLPMHESFTNAELFLYEKADWVAKTLQRLKAKQEEKKTIFTPETEFATYARKVQLVPDARQNVRVQIVPETVYIYYPAHRSIQDETLQTVIRKAVEHAWKVEAYEVLPQRMAQLAAQCNLTCKRLNIKNVRSYWGICMPDNSITLSIHLMHLPPHLIDFIILHELSHTVHKNHGAGFWNLLDRLASGKAREYTHELQKYSTRVY
ncbi:MAG: M48 family metallopeptidase [Prevotellaceae bacterium]|jgi:predicted metal-dependent hydrolase|nr:M48 family metallopeptidase [Prevotellaceae bacterium]